MDTLATSARTSTKKNVICGAVPAAALVTQPATSATTAAKNILG
jgi:hypothetical protein